MSSLIGSSKTHQSATTAGPRNEGARQTAVGIQRGGNMLGKTASAHRGVATHVADRNSCPSCPQT